jgi:hypothetical protein
MVPEVGIEPTRGEPRWILSPVRLPVSPLRHRGALYNRWCSSVKKELLQQLRKRYFVTPDIWYLFLYFYNNFAPPQTTDHRPVGLGRVFARQTLRLCHSYSRDNTSTLGRHTAQFPVSVVWPASFLPASGRHYRQLRPA